MIADWSSFAWGMAADTGIWLAWSAWKWLRSPKPEPEPDTFWNGRASADAEGLMGRRDLAGVRNLLAIRSAHLTKSQRIAIEGWLIEVELEREEAEAQKSMNEHRRIGRHA
jgi:hypothetical protein